jgi:hypothetical protein
MKIRPVGVELFHADGRADRQTGKTKLIVNFRNFANAPKQPISCACVFVSSWQFMWRKKSMMILMSFSSWWSLIRWVDDYWMSTESSRAWSFCKWIRFDSKHLKWCKVSLPNDELMSYFCSCRKRLEVHDSWLKYPCFLHSKCDLSF